MDGTLGADTGDSTVTTGSVTESDQMQQGNEGVEDSESAYILDDTNEGEGPQCLSNETYDPVTGECIPG